MLIANLHCMSKDVYINAHMVIIMNNGHTKLKGHGLKLNLIAEPFKDSQLPSNIQCTPTYCTLEPGSNRVTVGLRNISAGKIIVPSKTIVCQIQLGI